MYCILTTIDSPANPLFTVPSRCAQGLSLDLDPNYFASHSDDGLVAVWDRRYLRGSHSSGEPALLFNRSTDEYGRAGSQITSLRYSSTKPGTFAVLNTSGGLRIYETGKILDSDPPPTSSLGLFSAAGVVAAGVPEFHKSRKGWRDSAASLLDGTRINGGSSGSRTPNPRQEPGETLFVTRINDVVSPSRLAKNDRRIVSFDWMTDGVTANRGDILRTICLRNDGTPDVITCSGSATSLSFGSRNGLLITHGKDLKILPSPNTTLQLQLPDGVDTAKQLEERRPGESDPDPDIDSPTGSPGIRLGMHEGRRLGRSNSVVRPEDFLYDAGEVLKNDMCVVMRRRVEAGYEMDVCEIIPNIKLN